MYRPSCLIEAYVRPEKYWLVWAGPLANHLLNFNFIFLSDGGGMIGMFYGYIPLPAGPIPRQWTDLGWPDLIEAQPELSPAKCVG